MILQVVNEEATEGKEVEISNDDVCIHHMRSLIHYYMNMRFVELGGDPDMYITKWEGPDPTIVTNMKKYNSANEGERFDIKHALLYEIGRYVFILLVCNHESLDENSGILHDIGFDENKPYIRGDSLNMIVFDSAIELSIDQIVKDIAQM